MRFEHEAADALAALDDVILREPAGAHCIALADRMVEGDMLFVTSGSKRRATRR